MYYVLVHAHAPHSIALELCNQPLHNECTPVSKPITDDVTTASQPGAVELSLLRPICVLFLYSYMYKQVPEFSKLSWVPPHKPEEIYVF